MPKFYRFGVGILLAAIFSATSCGAEKPSFKRTENVVYGHKFGVALTMDVFTPTQNANGKGVIFAVSGGWFSSREMINPDFYNELLKRGYTVFAVCHGSQPKFTIPEILEDMNRSVRFIRFHAHDYHIDPDHIGISGGSAGGHLSLMQGVAGDQGIAGSKDPINKISSRVQAVACFFPPTDFLNYGKQDQDALGRGILSGFKAPFDFHELDKKTNSFVLIQDEEKRRAIGKKISPITFVASSCPPTLIIHGDADYLVPIQQAQSFITKMKEAGVPAELVVKHGAGHGWQDLFGDMKIIADWFDKYLTAQHPASPKASDTTPKKAASSHWPQFRGPNLLGTSTEVNLPSIWNKTQNIVWKADVPGLAWSCPIVWGDKVFLTTAIRQGAAEKPKKGLYFGGEQKKPPSDIHKWMVLCLDWRTGKILWKKVAHEGVPEFTRHGKNSYASETPVTDGERVYALFGNVGLFCYDLQGKELWSHKFGVFKTKAGWGTAASPVLYKDRIYVVNDNEEKSFIVALDKKTGSQVWQGQRDEKSNWSTPFLWENSARTEIVTPGSGKVRSYDLDGKLLWEFKGMSNITIPTPVAHGDLLYVSSGFPLQSFRPVYAIRPGASGDISLKTGETSNSFIAWILKVAAPYNPSPLVYDKYLYVLRDRGLLSCYDAESGKQVYSDQRLGSTNFTASPWAYEGKIFCLSEEGDTYVVQAGPEFKLLGKNSLEEMTLATPAIARHSLLLRTESKLYRIQNEGVVEK